MQLVSNSEFLKNLILKEPMRSFIAIEKSHLSSYILPILTPEIAIFMTRNHSTETRKSPIQRPKLSLDLGPTMVK